MVVFLYCDAEVRHLESGLRAEVLKGIEGWGWEVSLFVPSFVSQVGTTIQRGRLSRVPYAFLGVYGVEGTVGGLLEADAVEDEELQLWAPVADVA